jgi:3-methylcrotonyl-CoA carboxylase beta subunit
MTVAFVPYNVRHLFRNTLAARGTLFSWRRNYHASVLPSLISTTSPEFLTKVESMDILVAEVEAKMAEARLGGGRKAAERMRSKGKKLPRERSASSLLSAALCKNASKPHP